MIDANATANTCYAFYKYLLSYQFNIISASQNIIYRTAILARQRATYISVDAVKKLVAKIEEKLNYCTKASANPTQCLDNYVSFMN